MANSAVDAAIQGLKAIGIAVPPSMEALIEMLLNEGEDVLTAIPHIVSIIEQLGGNAWQTLDEVATGMQHYGPVGYVQHQIDLAFDPHINRIQDIHQSKQTLLAMHRDALTTLKTRVNTLSPGGSSPQLQTYTGASADAMLLSLNTLSSSLSAHLDLLEQSLEIDRHFLTNIQTVKNVSIGTALITLLIIAVVIVVALLLALPSGGISLAVGGGIVITLTAGDAALLLGAIIAAFALWANQHQLLNQPIQWNWGTSPTSPTTTSGPPQKGPTINQARAHQNDLPLPGKATGPHVYYPPKGAHGDPAMAWNKAKGGFSDASGNVWVWDTKHKDHWDVQLKDGSHINVFPDGVERGQRQNDNKTQDNQGQQGNKGKS